jgi:hypothetical protein
MPKAEFQDYICRPYCVFYKPEVKEELFCRGALMLELLVRQRRLSPEDCRGLRKDDRFSPGQETGLESAVCADCPFRSEDCDFQSRRPPEDSRPCGGLYLLRQLLLAGKIALGDLAERPV